MIIHYVTEEIIAITELGTLYGFNVANLISKILSDFSLTFLETMTLKT